MKTYEKNGFALPAAIGGLVIVGVLVTVVFSPSTDSADTGGTGGSGGTDLFDLGDVLVPLIAMAVPVGLVAAGVIYVGDRFLE